MAVYAPDRDKNLDVYGTFNKDVSKVLWEGRRARAKTFHIAGDLNIELRQMMTTSRSSTRCMVRYADKDVTMIKRNLKS